MSPFYEPDGTARGEDPPGQSGDHSVFNRLFSDFEFEPEAGEAPVEVYFEEDAGATVLPVSKLRAWKDQITLNHRLTTSDDARRLHGKLLVLEGRGKKGQDAFLVTLHGSPNFTSAALLTTPPHGNAELAVLTWLPARGGGANRIRSALSLGELFSPVLDWSALRSTIPVPLPQREQTKFTLTDATFQVVGQAVLISVRNVPPGAARFRLSALIEGAWVAIAEGAWVGEESWSIPTADLMRSDSKTKLPTLLAARVRVEIFTAEGAILTSDEAPLNVDAPEQFCGLAMVGPLLLTLDERIAQTGAGAPMTYREQQKWLERFRQHQGETSVLAGPTHQANLDKFFRNLHAGLKGFRGRLDASPRSEFMLRNALRQLSRWCAEAVAPDGKVATAECRVFLLDRLATEMLAALERVTESRATATRLSTTLGEVGLGAAVETAQAWLSTAAIADTAVYIRKIRRRFTEVQQTLGRLRR